MTALLPSAVSPPSRSAPASAAPSAAAWVVSAVRAARAAAPLPATAGVAPGGRQPARESGAVVGGVERDDLVVVDLQADAVDAVDALDGVLGGGVTNRRQHVAGVV